jgi:hypothetical protein
MAAALAALLLLAPGPAAAQTAAPAKGTPAASNAPADPGWPRFFEKEGSSLTVYQPQVLSWEKYRELKGRAAFELVPGDAPRTLGVVTFTAKTVADTAAHTVQVKKISVDEVRFASNLDEEAEKKTKKAFEKLFPKEGMTVSLDRIVANLERNTAPPPPVEVKNDPPTIFVSNEPAVLLFVDGEPVYAPIEGSAMKYVVNTNWDLFWNETTAHYYLLDDTVWRTSQKLDGEWVPDADAPGGDVEAAVRRELRRREEDDPAARGEGAEDEDRLHEQARRARRLRRHAGVGGRPRHGPRLREEHRRRLLPPQGGGAVLLPRLGALVPVEVHGGAVDLRDAGPARRLPQDPGEEPEGERAGVRPGDGAGGGRGAFSRRSRTRSS